MLLSVSLLFAIYLSILFSSSLSWCTHISFLRNKSRNPLLHILSLFSSFFTLHHLGLYISLVCPILECCSIISYPSSPTPSPLLSIPSPLLPPLSFPFLYFASPLLLPQKNPTLLLFLLLLLLLLFLYYLQIQFLTFLNLSNSLL